MMAQPKTRQVKQVTYQSLCSQITALEFKLASVSDPKQFFSLNGKIKKLKKQASELEWLGR